MKNVIVLIVMLSVIMQNVAFLTVILSILMKCRVLYCFAEHQYA
jgi:hypothetical protein